METVKPKTTSETQTTAEDLAKFNGNGTVDITPDVWRTPNKQYKSKYIKGYQHKATGVTETGIPWKDDETLTERGLEFHETKLEQTLKNSHFEYQLKDADRPAFSYIWLQNTSAKVPNWEGKAGWTPTAAWGPAYSHITLVRERAPDSENPGPNYLLDWRHPKTEGLAKGVFGSTHLTLRAHKNDKYNSWGGHVNLPANSTAMAAHPLLVSRPGDKEVQKLWSDFTNQVSLHLKDEFTGYAKEDWAEFLDQLKADVKALLQEYGKFLQDMEKTI
ncbi:hypothetical protein Aspvir_009890 [Aspergillus viridinutans]|uniref:Uncharacterized protein n=1 Tax=Aspergillus viridinutans TaxID=75553 RepID=A0A9P3C4M4_ASPVI|nr:uncharacterized protein Aspvir_009890 [Aspergillus viridinutans]GIK05777.1 hypothetical protein Aspvir_009890 [Aspergillus viridinutans]